MKNIANKIIIFILTVGLMITVFYSNSVNGEEEYGFGFGYEGGTVTYDISGIFEGEGTLDPLLTNVNELPNYITASYNNGTIIFNVGDGQQGHDVVFDNYVTKDAALFMKDIDASIELYLNNNLTINVKTVTLPESLNEYYGILCNGRLWIKGNGTLTINFISESNNNALSSYTMYGIAKFATVDTSELIIGEFEDSSQRPRIIIKDNIDHNNSIYDTVGISLLPNPSSIDYTQTYFFIRNADVNIESNKYGIYFHDPSELHDHSIDMMNSNLTISSSGPCTSDYVGLYIDAIRQYMENEGETSNIEINVWPGSKNVGILAYGIVDVANASLTINKELSPEGDFSIIGEDVVVGFYDCDLKLSGCISAQRWVDITNSKFFIEDWHRCIHVRNLDNEVYLLLNCEEDDDMGRFVVYGEDEDDYCIEMDYDEYLYPIFDGSIIKNLASDSATVSPNEGLNKPTNLEEMKEFAAKIKKYKNILYNDGSLMLVYDEEGNIIGSDFITSDYIMEKPEEPTKQGYKFLYWYSDDPEVPFNFDEPIFGDVHLQAKWEKLPDPQPIKPTPEYVIPKTGIK